MAPFDAAMTRLVLGDVVSAVPLLQRALRGDETGSALAARLALLVIREPLAPREATLEALATLERECIALGTHDLARLVRGAIAATTEHPDRAVPGVVTECELHGDELAATIVSGIDFLVRLRRGRATVAQSTSLAHRLERLGRADAATWAIASGALLASASGSTRAAELIVEAESAAIATGVDVRVDVSPVLDGARAMTARGARGTALAAAARRSALLMGLPRLPRALPLPISEHSRPDRPRGGATARADARHPHITVGCFGGFHLRADGAEIDLRAVRPQARALLRMLALNSGAPLHRELIADVLWGDLGTESAVHALHVSVSSLRRVLPHAMSVPAGSIVERVGEAYRLGLIDRRDCDLADFDDHLADAAISKARHDAQATAGRLRAAMALYVGDVLPEDGPAEWASGARERYRVRAAEAASSLAHLELRLEDARAAVAAASRAVEIDPWLDESWRTLVTVHRVSGDVVAAQRAADGYRRMRVALGVE